MTPRQIIIQAGGRGSRLENYTRNRPKCLVPVDGKPLLEHTLAAFPGAEAVVIVDYRADVVERWLCAFPPSQNVGLCFALGEGSAAGIEQAARMLPYPDEPVAVIWSDLLFPNSVRATILEAEIVIATTRDFPCRYETTPGDGVMGLFWFRNAAALADSPTEGEFVDWVLSKPHTAYRYEGAKEYGTLAALQDHWSDTPARFFNEVTIEDDKVSKTTSDPTHASKLTNEVAWYRHVTELGFGNVPTIYVEGPRGYVMSRVTGVHPWQMKPDTRVLGGIMDTLERLHGLEEAPLDPVAVQYMYRDKPASRLVPVAALLPKALTRPYVKINGRYCRNVISAAHYDVIPMAHALASNLLGPPFRLIHGDPTFSNILIPRTGFPFLIDPRGRFGSVQFYGDPLYDYAKLWYSLSGGYDSFNRGHYTLEMGEGWADVQIKPSGWEMLAPMFEERMGAEAMRKIRILHGLIWLSLVGVVGRDYDGMIAAYLKGLLVLEEASV